MVMPCNDVLRRIRYAIDLADHQMLSMIAGGDPSVTADDLERFLKKPDDEAFMECPESVMAAFLNGLIIHRRGSRGAVPPPEKTLNNNQVLKKLRVAFALRDEDIHRLLGLGGLTLTRSEINAFFRAPQHKNFKLCGDQVIKKFLQGLTRELRPQ